MSLTSDKIQKILYEIGEDSGALNTANKRNVDSILFENSDIYQIKYYHDIKCNRRFIGKPIIFFKRLVRRCLKFLIEPIVSEQNSFNNSAVDLLKSLYNSELDNKECLNSILEQQDHLKANIARLEEKVNFLQEEIEKSRKL